MKISYAEDLVEFITLILLSVGDIGNSIVYALDEKEYFKRKGIINISKLDEFLTQIYPSVDKDIIDYISHKVILIILRDNVLSISDIPHIIKNLFSVYNLREEYKAQKLLAVLKTASWLVYYVMSEGRYPSKEEFNKFIEEKRALIVEGVKMRLRERILNELVNQVSHGNTYKRIVLLGDPGTGKTKSVSRLIGDRYGKSHEYAKTGEYNLFYIKGRGHEVIIFDYGGEYSRKSIRNIISGDTIILVLNKISNLRMFMPYLIEVGTKKDKNIRLYILHYDNGEIDEDIKSSLNLLFKEYNIIKIRSPKDIYKVLRKEVNY